MGKEAGQGLQLALTCINDQKNDDLIDLLSLVHPAQQCPPWQPILLLCVDVQLPMLYTSDVTFVVNDRKQS